MAQPISVLQGPVFDAGSPYSAVMSLSGSYVVGLVVPEDWTPAVISVLVSPSGDNYYDLFDGKGSEFTFNAVPGTMINVDPNMLMMAAYMRLRSGTRKKEVPQEAERRFRTIVKSTIASRETESTLDSPFYSWGPTTYQMVGGQLYDVGRLLLQ